MIQFIELKKTYEGIARAITTGAEPITDLKIILQFLRELASNNGEFLIPIQDDSNATGFTKSQLRYIFEDLSTDLIKKICRERSNDEQYLGLCGSLQEAFLDLFNVCLDKGIFNIEFLLSCRTIFDYDCQLHKWHFQIPDQTLQRLFTKGSAQQWRLDLKEGDKVDALIHNYDRQGFSKGAGWSQAQIIRVQGDLLQLDYLFEPSTSRRELDRWSIELAPFESETKQIWEWKQTLNVDENVDAQDDTFKWLKSTIIKIYEERDGDKVYPMTVIGLRVYTQNGHRKDDRGNYEGFGDRFDEKIPLYSPKITKYRTNSIKQGIDDDGELDDSLDEFMETETEFKRNWAVPRPRKCTSSEYIRILNQFCNNGGLELIYNILQNTEHSEEVDGFNLTVVAILFSMVSLPSTIYHKDVIADYGKKFIEVGQKRLLKAPDKALRDVRREAIEAIVKAVDSLNKRIEKKEEREKITEIFKLDVSLLCLNSSFLQRRIQGIHDLTQLIKNHRIYTSRLTGQHLIEWLEQNQVLNLLFDAKKTHLQIVQRCDEIVRLLLQEDQLTEDRLNQFWSLTKSDMRVEVYKIISDCSFSFHQQHLDFIFGKICNEIPLEKLDMDDFNCLQELGKYSKDKDSQFKDKVLKYFWQLIVKSGSKNTVLLEHCSQMFRDMVKYYNIESKAEILKDLLNAIKDQSVKSTIPSIKLLKGLIKDQYERNTSSYTYSGYSTATGCYSTSNIETYPNQTSYGTSAGGSALRTRTPQKQAKGPDDPQDQNVDPEANDKVEEVQLEQKMTLQSLLTSLQQDDQIIELILNDLQIYYNKAIKYVKDQQLDNLDTKKLFVSEGPYSHFVEVDERLQFIQFFAQQSNSYCISKKELGVIYDLLVANSCSQQDEQEFLIWCKSSCESQSQSLSILDLDEVGQFFTEKISQKLFDVKNIAPVGLEFLQQYFISLNEREGNLEKVVQKQTATSYQNNNNGKWVTSYSWVSGNKVSSYSNEKKEETKIPQFIIKIDPQNLLELEMLWTLVLTTQQPEVVKKVIDFFIKIHTNTHQDLSRKDILQNFIKRCMKIINEGEKNIQIRVIRLLKNLIDQTEEQGVGSVLPHGALMKGESFEVVIKNKKVTHMAGELTVQVYSNTTLWELKQEVSLILDFNARYLVLSYFQNSQQIEFKDIDNGKTMKALGVTAGMQFSALKKIPDEYISVAPLVQVTGELTQAARRIFDQWFDMYSEQDGTWSTMSAGYFIQGCCGDPPSVPNDNRVTSLFNTYDTDKDGKIQRDEFMSFYLVASRDRPQTVRENMKAHNVRPDLVKWSEFCDDKAIQVEELPRFFMSKDSDNFNQLMQLLNNYDEEVSNEVWDLVQMLATNQGFYKQVLNLEIAKQNQSKEVDWSQFFDKKQQYKLLYTLQIVQAVLQNGENESKRAKCLNSLSFHTAKLQPDQIKQRQKRQQNQTQNIDEQTDEKKLISQSQSVQDNDEEENLLRKQWAEDFIDKGGFQYILTEFMNLNISNSISNLNSEHIELKYLAFILHLLRTFLMAALSTNDSLAYEMATLARKNSSLKSEEKSSNVVDTTQAQEPQSKLQEESQGSSFKQLQKILEGEKGNLILNQLDYNQLQNKVISIVWQILQKQQMIFEDKLIIDNALNLWVGCIQHQPNIFQLFINSNINSQNINAEEFLISGLLECKQDQVREQFKSTIASICTNNTIDSKSPIEYIIKFLTNNLSKISGKKSSQFLSLFCDLLDQYKLIKNDSHPQVFKTQELLSSVINQISEENNRSKIVKDDKNLEEVQNQSSKESSNLLFGLMDLAGKVLDSFVGDEDDQQNQGQSESQKQQEELINEIFSKYLFPSVFNINQNKKEIFMIQVIEQKNSQKSQNSVQEKSHATQAAYRLLQGLLKRNIQLMDFFLNNCLKVLMDFVQRQNQWGYSPPVSQQGRQQYVGLRNPGCICYMNSMLQQFFMIPPLRYNLLSTDDNAEEDIKLYKGDYIDDNVLHQLQHVMANLELSERSDYLPKGFCFAFKDFEGLPTNTGEQKDAQEFLNIIFDRIETSLKDTPKKYLFQSVFGGKTCSQLVCKECGKVKNRIEDMNNLSLTVKDLKGVHESLQKQIEGEIISDYECSGCKKKVDIHKRTLIAETPNVLIIHLQRILFDFNSFQNEKMNQYFEFPNTLDLKPYSYYEVMSKEERAPETAAEEDQNKEKEEEENPEPIHEDCFEYVLSGVTVHSGSANAGHYWSLISTERDGLGLKKALNPNQLQSEKWMEFNDSHVRDFDNSKIKEEAFGGDGGNQSFGISSFDGWGISGGGSSYGKSGYMLFYERVNKKPIKIIKQDEENKECISEISYYQCVEKNEKPNRIFQQVLEDQLKFGFEQDIYQSEFFDFMLGIQKTINQYNYNQQDVQELTKKAMEIGSKSTLEIFAKAYHNNKFEEHIQVLLEMIHKDKSLNLHRQFLNDQYEKDGFDYLFSLLLECPEFRVRTQVANLLKYILIKLKFAEKDYQFEPEDYEVQNDDGNKLIMQKYRAVSTRFIIRAIDLLNTKVAKNWSTFEQFHDLLFTFALANEEQIEQQVFISHKNHKIGVIYDSEDESSRIGLNFFAKIKFVQKICDFMLGKKSPLCEPNEKRFELGSYSSNPEFGSCIKLLTALISDVQIQAEYPISDIDKQLLVNPHLLKTILGSPTASKQFGKILADTCKDNYQLSKKISKVFLRSIESAHLDAISGYLKALKPFLLVNDSLKQLKLEWIFGIPDFISKKNQGDKRPKYGLELVDRINDEVIQFETPIIYPQPSSDYALVNQINKSRGKWDIQCISCLKELLALMKKDNVIARFVYNLPSLNYQGARFIDWFKPYLHEQLFEQQKLSAGALMHFRQKLESIQKAINHYNFLEPMFKQFEEEDLKKISNIKEGEFLNLEKDWLRFYKNCEQEAIPHFPPQIIIGQIINDDKEFKTFDDHALVRVQIYQIDCEYSYGAPTGLFNLSIPHMIRRTGTYSTESYFQFKRAIQAGKEKDKKLENEDIHNELSEQQQMGAEDPSLNKPASSAVPTVANYDDFIFNTKEWNSSKLTDTVLLRVMILNKTHDTDVKVWYKLSYKGDDDEVNVKLSNSKRKTYLGSKNIRLMETLQKIDPTKPYFFKNLENLHIELDVTVRDTNTGNQGGIRKVHYALQQTETFYQGTQTNDFDDEDRDDDQSYQQYQNNPVYSGYQPINQEQNEAIVNLMGIQPQNSYGEAQSNGSTEAVMDEHHAGGSDGNGSATKDIEDISSYRDDIFCTNCKVQIQGNEFQCSACGQYIGNQ